MYKENITNKTLKQVKELFQKDKIVSKRLDTSKWAYLEMENSTNFADGLKIYSFDEDLPESIKVVFYTKPYEIVYDDKKQIFFDYYGRDNIQEIEVVASKILQIISSLIRASKRERFQDGLSVY